MILHDNTCVACVLKIYVIYIPHTHIDPIVVNPILYNYCIKIFYKHKTKPYTVYIRCIHTEFCGRSTLLYDTINQIVVITTCTRMISLTATSVIWPPLIELDRMQHFNINLQKRTSKIVDALFITGSRVIRLLIHIYTV